MSPGSHSQKPGLKERLEILCRDMIDKGILFPEATEYFERCFIREIVQRNGGNITRAASVLGIHRNTLSKKVNHQNNIK
ncbi:MAG: helix-turn-helix domain-containing protein [Acidobacteriota bacterium]